MSLLFKLAKYFKEVSWRNLDRCECAMVRPKLMKYGEVEVVGQTMRHRKVSDDEFNSRMNFRSRGRTYFFERQTRN